MKSEIVFKRAYNDALDVVAALRPGQALASEYAMGRRLGVSRTTVRKVLTKLGERGVIAPGATGLVATGATANGFPQSETESTSDHVERNFMEWMLRDDPSPGSTISELDLARRFGVATTSIREFLNRFQRFGLIEKRPNSGWVFKGFTEAFALELFEIREMFELRTARRFGMTAPDSPLWSALDQLRAEHAALLDAIDARFHDFPALDNRFHRLINSASPNRFIDSFYDIITLIFHYHYQWNKQDERQRNEVAIREHLTYMDALKTRNLALIDLACQAHLASARETLLKAIRA